MLELIKQPRFWLVAWGGLGIVFLLYVIIAASLKPESGSGPSAADLSPSLLVGEMADFEYAFPSRGAPKIPFQYRDKDMTLADFRGRVVLVNFWATWCAPCLKELPSLDQLEARLGGRDFEVVAVAADPRGPQAAALYLADLEIEHLKLYSDQNLRFASAIGGANILPVSILYDANGQEIGRLVGEADWVSEEALRLIGSVLP